VSVIGNVHGGIEFREFDHDGVESVGFLVAKDVGGQHVHPLTVVREALEATVVGGEPAQATRNSPVPLILPIHAAVDTSVPPPPTRWGDRLWPGHVMGANER
jgi:hypothetical protein